MIRLLAGIAVKHLLARKRQSAVSLMGITLGVAFFLAISSLMQGSERDFIHRLVDNSPHITIIDQFRNPRLQPLQQLRPAGAVEIRHVKPLTETRGIRGYQQAFDYLHTLPGLLSSPTLEGQALVSFAGKVVGVTMTGVIPSQITTVTTIQNYMRQGAIDDLNINPDGIVIGDQLARDLALEMDNNLIVSATSGQSHTFKIIGIFHTGRATYDDSQVFVQLKRAQALFDRPNRINNIIIKIDDPYQARAVAAGIEGRVGYKSISWQEAFEDLMNTLTIRNIIMYTVVSAVLVVAAFGIYNVISTVVMEKQRDVAILKSMGFRANDIELIFLIQGVALGLAGNLTGLPLGMALMAGLQRVQIKFPGGGDTVNLPIAWDWPQFAIAAAFALTAAVLAALLPARKAARLQPVEILRGGT